MTREIALEILKSLDVYRGGDIDQAIQFAIKALEQEPIIKKIKAEIIEKSITDCELHGCGTSDLLIDTSEALAIIDKYTAESEG